MKKRAEFEEKYKVDVQTDRQGKSIVVDREKDEVELEEEKKKIEKLAKKGIVRRTKEEKRVLRRQREKQRKNKNKKGSNNDSLDFNDFKDDVAFGDTVDAPPTLKFRGFEKSSSSKPAEGGGLLLSQKQSSRDGFSSEPKAKKSEAVDGPESEYGEGKIECGCSVQGKEGRQFKCSWMTGIGPN